MRVPLLMLNGRDDSLCPVETNAPGTRYSLGGALGITIGFPVKFTLKV